MPKKIQLNIPKPCHEDWDAMTPVEKGKFCGSCQKQVIDFSSMSDRQVAEFFKKPVLRSSKDGSVCGRFMTDQLDRDLEIPKKRLPWLKYFFTIALPAFFVSLKATGSKTQGQPIVRKVNADTTGKKIYDDVKMMGMVARPPMIQPAEDVRGVKGRVVDAITGNALPDAKVFLFSTIGKEDIKVSSDGSFVLNIYRKITVKSIEISMPGYITQKLKLADFMKAVNAKQPIKLVPEEMVLGQIALAENEIPPVKDTLPACSEPVMGKPSFQTVKGEIAFVSPVKNYTVSGTVLDQQGNPIAGASIVMKGTRQGVAAGVDGKFSLQLKSQHDQIVLVGSSVGTIPVEVKIDLRSKNENIVIRLDIILEGYDLGYIVVKPVKNTSKDKRVTTIQKEQPKLVSSMQSSLRVVPNPVSSGSSVNIEWKQAEEGYYTLELINQSGQAVHQKEIWIDADARLLNINLPVLPAASYFLVITHKRTGKRFEERLIIH